MTEAEQTGAYAGPVDGGTALSGGLDVRLVGTATQRLLRTRLRGAREFLQVP